MTPAFQKAVNRVLSHEGGYVNNPLDPGKETIWGITARTARKWGYKGDMRFMSRDTAVEIYEQEYWTPVRGDELPFYLAFPTFDAAVNSGPPQAIKWLQRSIGCVDDGIIGPATLYAAKAMPPIKTLLSMVEREEFQTNLPTWPAFGKGWCRRGNTNLRFFVEDFLENLANET
jgi:lysozyme family protein